MIEIIDSFHDIISDVRIILFEEEEYSYRFKAFLEFIDNSKLVIKDYIFDDSQRKYSFHWMTKNNELICRWDDTDHWNEVASYPHHKHIGKTQSVESSLSVTLEDVLSEIRILILNLLSNQM